MHMGVMHLKCSVATSTPNRANVVGAGQAAAAHTRTGGPMLEMSAEDEERELAELAEIKALLKEAEYLTTGLRHLESTVNAGEMKFGPTANSKLLRQEIARMKQLHKDTLEILVRLFRQ